MSSDQEEISSDQKKMTSHDSQKGKASWWGTSWWADLLRSAREISFPVWLAGVSSTLYFLAGLVVIHFQTMTFKMTAFLWALACFVCGILLGFLFSIPHAPTRTPSESTAPQGPATNLEQLSDWLTKVLLGAGLVQLQNLPGQIEKAGVYIAKGLDPKTDYSQFAAALVIYFSGAGFFSGYVGARILYRAYSEGYISGARKTDG